MSTKDSYRERIRRTLEQRSGGAADAAAIAEAMLITWLDVSARLIPVIGTGGVDVIFRRSLHLTSTTFPWIATTEYHMHSAALLANLKEQLVGRDKDAALEASYILLVTSIEILSNLIGESLVDQLLGTMWMDPLKQSEQENNHEQKSDHKKI